VYNLWTTRTYRSSCDSPNLQNIPKRDEEQVEFRKIFVPRYDLLLDADHKGSEVVVQALIANDTVLLKQLKEGFDPHRFWASRMYQIAEKDVTKKQRYSAKNQFVFPLLYGSYYGSIAKTTGINEVHLKKCQEEFYSMYKGIRQYQQNMLYEYEHTGKITTPLGFERHSPLSRNQIINNAIQATSFHYLLDTLIKLVKLLKEFKFKSLPVLQVHDSILSDMVESEKDDYVSIIEELTANKTWDFAKQLQINVEYSYGKNWLNMKQYGVK
jgi:DNA polymerase-1